MESAEANRTIISDRALVVIALAIAHAMMFILMFPGVNAWPLAFVAIAPLAIIGMQTMRPLRNAVIVLLVCWLQWLWMSRWTFEVTVAGYPMMSLCLALYPALFVLALACMRRSNWFRNWPATVLVPVAWGGLEFLRGRIAFDGYPWFLVAHPTIEWLAFAQGAALVGTYGLGLLVAAVSGLLVDFVWMKRGQITPRTAWLAAGCVGLILVANVVFGVISVGTTAREQSARAPDLTVLAIQTNLPQDNKIGWTIEQQMQDIPSFIAQTRQALADAQQAGHQIDLICWPETMVPGAGFEFQTQAMIEQFGPAFEHLYMWAQHVRSLVADTGIPMLVGSGAWVDSSIQTDDQGMYLDRGREFNSAYLIEPVDRTPGIAQQRADKYFLTPFGETMPYISNWPWLEEKLLAVGARGMTFTLHAADEVRPLHLHLQRGEDTQPDATASIDLLTPICFEDTVPWLVRRMVRMSDDSHRAVIVNLSNDGWFGSYDPGRQQHVQIARFRCIENRVPMVRCVNTGLSVHVNSAGKVVDVVGASRYGDGRIAGWLVAEVHLDGQFTLYRSTGDWLGWVAFAALVSMCIVGWRQGRRTVGRGVEA